MTLQRLLDVADSSGNGEVLSVCVMFEMSFCTCIKFRLSHPFGSR